MDARVDRRIRPQKSPAMSIKMSRYRWLEVLMLGLSGFALTALAAPSVVDCRTQVFPIWSPVVAGSLAVTAYWIFGRDRAFAWLGLRHFPSYPPPWVAVVFGCALLVGYLSLNPAAMAAMHCPPIDTVDWGVSRVLLLWLIGAFCIVVLVGWKAGGRLAIRVDRARFEPKEERQRKSPVRFSADALGNDFQALRQWLQDDHPISHPNFDAFGHSRIARRIASRVSGSSQSTIALVGKLGAGKSSVLSLVNYYLLEDGVLGSKVTVVRVSLWPFDKTEAAVRGVLSAMTEELSRHVNTGPLSGLKAEYIGLIESASKPLGGLLASQREPSQVLADYDRTASAIGLRIVLWVEDFERFAGVVDSKPPEIDRLEPLHALLSSLSKLESVQVVLASSSVGIRFDIEKIARIVEYIPEIDGDSVLNVLRQFRSGCLAGVPEIFDSADASVRKEFERPDVAAGSLHSVFPEKVGSLPQALAILCNNPRRLKHSLRSCLDVWERLRGGG